MDSRLLAGQAMHCDAASATSERHTGQSSGEEQPWSKHMKLRLFFDTDKVLFHEKKSSSKSSTRDDILMLQVPKSEGINGGIYGIHTPPQISIQGRADKIWGPVRNSKIRPYLTRNI
jgi:hypothetical protein